MAYLGSVPGPWWARPSASCSSPASKRARSPRTRRPAARRVVGQARQRCTGLVDGSLTVLLPPSPCGRDRSQIIWYDGVDVAEIVEHGVGAKTVELGSVNTAGCHQHAVGAGHARAGQVVAGVADDPDVVARERAGPRSR